MCPYSNYSEAPHFFPHQKKKKKSETKKKGRKKKKEEQCCVLGTQTKTKMAKIKWSYSATWGQGGPRVMEKMFAKKGYTSELHRSRRELV